MYSHEMEGSSESRWLLKALRESAHELETQLYGLDEDQLRWRPSEGAMSLKEIAAHLRDCEQHLLQSLELLLAEDEPRLPSFDGDALVLDHDYRDTDLYDVLGTYSYLRHCVVDVLWTSAGEWERAGRHPFRGSVSIANLAREQHEHDLEHLWEARHIREELLGGQSLP